MNREEFTKIVRYLEAGIGKPIDPDQKTAMGRFEVYFDLLGEFPYNAMVVACQRVLLEHPWASFPSAAELRAAAAETMLGEVKELSSAEAWEMAWSAAGRIDLEMQGPYWVQGKLYDSQCAYVLDGMPRLVINAMKAYGFPALCCGKEPVGVIRGQFIKIFEQLATKQKRINLYPPKLIEDIKRIGMSNQISNQIGHLPEGLDDAKL